MLLSATVAGVGLTIGLAAPASAAIPVSTVNSTAAFPTQTCKTMYGQPLLPILCVKPSAPASLPVPQSDGSVPWAGLRGCVTNHREVQGALAALADVDPGGKYAVMVIGGTWCLYGLASSGSRRHLSEPGEGRWRSTRSSGRPSRLPDPGPGSGAEQRERVPSVGVVSRCWVVSHDPGTAQTAQRRAPLLHATPRLPHPRPLACSPGRPEDLPPGEGIALPFAGPTRQRLPPTPDPQRIAAGPRIRCSP